MRLMITQGTSAFAQRVARHIQQSTADAQVYFGAADELPKVLETSGKYIRIPNHSDASFVHQLLKVALDRQLTHLLPLDFDECRELSEAKMLFDEYGIVLLMPDPANWPNENIVVSPPSAFELQLHINGPSGLYSISDAGERYWCLARHSHSANF